MGAPGAGVILATGSMGFSWIVGSWQSREGQGQASSAGPQGVEGVASNTAVLSVRVSVGKNGVWFLGPRFLVGNQCDRMYLLVTYFCSLYWSSTRLTLSS